MHIYPSEKEIETLILASNTSNVSAKFSLTTDVPDEKSVASILDDMKQRVSAIDLPEDMHPDLLYGSSILVSTNMNDNDDIFLPEHTFSAKDTPIHTPFNVEHESSDIIGHIISSKVVNSDGDVIDSISSNSDVFDIEVGFVIYQFIYPDIASNIVTLASVGQQFVSMECILTDFDYGLVDDEGNISVVERNEATSFLTKHLRRYGGSGKYENKRLGRVLKGIRFVGMGSVSVPANPDSKFTQFKVLAEKQNSLYESEGKHDNDNPEEENSVNINDQECLLITAKGNVMKIENLDQAQEKIQALEDEKAALSEDLDSVKAEKVELEQSVTDVTAERDSAQAELEGVKSELEAEKQKVEVAEQTIEQLNETVEAKSKELEDKDSELTEATSKVEEFESARVLAERVAELESLGFEVSDEKKEDLKNMSDEVYASTVDWIKSIRPDTKPEDNDESDSKADVEDLDNASPDDNTDVVGGDSDEEDESSDLKVAASLVKVLRAKAHRTVK